MVYIIGDSHVSIFSGVDTRNDGKIHIQPEYGYCYAFKDGEMITLRPRNEFINNIPNVIPIKMGSHTAYNLLTKLDKLNIIIDDYNIGNGDTLLLCFGEIDIRAHIGFKESIGDAITECVDRYVSVIEELKGNGFKVGVFAPYASLPNELTYNVGQNYGNSQTRNKMTTTFNHYLKQRMGELGMKFLDIHHLMLNEDYSSNKIYFKDNIHASKEVLPFIIEALKELI